MKEVKGKEAETMHKENIKKMEKALGVTIAKINNVPKIKKNIAEFYQKPKDKDYLNEKDMEELLEMEKEMEKELTEEVKAKLTGRKAMKVDEMIYDVFEKWADCLKKNIDNDMIISHNPMESTLGFNYVEGEIACQRSIKLNEVRTYFRSSNKNEIDKQILDVVKVPSDEKAIEKIKAILNKAEK